jgi:glycosyltransferase involved in cell wall biosynthesis
MNKLPKISIITPSFNQGQFIEETIQSVLNQDHPDLEYIVIDGGSTDNTLDILRKYNDSILWMSEPDRGQVDAINKGLRRATGEIVAFLNSDDLYEPGALWAVSEYAVDHPEAMLITGQCRNIDEKGEETRKAITLYKNFWLGLRSYRVLLVLNYISQPATFWRYAVTEQIGYLDESLHYTMDYDYWLRIGCKYPIHYLHRNLACFRIHSSSKSGTTAHKQFDEELFVAGKYGSGLPLKLHRFHRFVTVAIYKGMLSNLHSSKKKSLHQVKSAYQQKQNTSTLDHA